MIASILTLLEVPVLVYVPEFDWTKRSVGFLDFPFVSCKVLIMVLNVIIIAAIPLWRIFPIDARQFESISLLLGMFKSFFEESGVASVFGSEVNDNVTHLRLGGYGSNDLVHDGRSHDVCCISHFRVTTMLTRCLDHLFACMGHTVCILNSNKFGVN